MEKLPKLERGGENRRGTSPMMGKNDSEARKLRELSNGGDRARFLFHRSWGRTAKFTNKIQQLTNQIKTILLIKKKAHGLTRGKQQCI
jgi:hypothetical protein